MSKSIGIEELGFKGSNQKGSSFLYDDYFALKKDAKEEGKKSKSKIRFSKEVNNYLAEHGNYKHVAFHVSKDEEEFYMFPVSEELKDKEAVKNMTAELSVSWARLWDLIPESEVYYSVDREVINFNGQEINAIKFNYGNPKRLDTDVPSGEILREAYSVGSETGDVNPDNFIDKLRDNTKEKLHVNED